MLQPVCGSVTPARSLTPRGLGPGHYGPTCHARVTAGRSLGAGAAVRHVAAILPARARTRCAFGIGAGGGSGTTEPEPEPVPAPVVAGQAEAVAQELESLEEAAIAGEDEGRRPTDYDRRAHIFEESSRVFRELKQRRDGDGLQGGADGSGTAGETATREPHQLG